MTAAAAAAKKAKVCPECGADLKDKSVAGHAADHWPEVLAAIPANKGAIAKREKLLALAEEEGD